MPTTTVVGHGKNLYSGKIGDKRVLCWQGRVHMYEGYNSMQLTFITYLSAFLGAKHMILTNSSGGGLEGMQVGSLMVSRDHINFSRKCAIPAIFNDPRVGTRNPHSTDAHSKYLADLALETAGEMDLNLFEGNYCWTTGPCYETPLETTYLRKMGGGAFGMSTVPEIASSGQVGMECVVLTMITNLAAGLQKKLTHTEVFEEAKKAGPVLASLVTELIKKIDLDRPNNVRILDTVESTGKIESYNMKAPEVSYPIADWIAPAVA